MMDILKTARELDLPDWWICAGFVRSKIWDVLHGFEKRTPLPDIDVVYFDKTNGNEQEEKRLEKELYDTLPGVRWSLKNEARMHVRNNVEPYTSTVDAISKFPETATALGIKLKNDGNLMLTAPHGVEDVLHMIVKPTPYILASKERLQIFEERIRTKKWDGRWDRVRYFEWLF
ncbi:nucleotidyltransferase family protein [Virgibacillus byunsanensis]|uniref:Nucleotidyltransferase family protein n=1 Tax=Virgibacillus byunsanensis TaxID=570945 RepID=A0ABW3LPS6_9BACI